MNIPQLTLFFDGRCPLCKAEMDRLKQLDHQQTLHYINLQDADALKAYPNLDRDRAMTILQGQLANGQMIEGLDVTHKAWSLVGKGHLTLITRLPVLRYVFDRLYLVFAKHRYTISGWLTGQKYTESCRQCQLPKR